MPVRCTFTNELCARFSPIVLGIIDTFSNSLDIWRSKDWGANKVEAGSLIEQALETIWGRPENITGKEPDCAPIARCASENPCEERVSERAFCPSCARSRRHEASPNQIPLAESSSLHDGI